MKHYYVNCSQGGLCSGNVGTRCVDNTWGHTNVRPPVVDEKFWGPPDIAYINVGLKSGFEPNFLGAVGARVCSR